MRSSLTDGTAPPLQVSTRRSAPEQYITETDSLGTGTRTGGTDSSNNWSWQRHIESADYLGIFPVRYSQQKIYQIRTKSEN